MSELAALRADIPLFSGGMLLFVLGLAALVAGSLRSGSRITLLSFGSFCAVYGLRLASYTRPARLLVVAPPAFWEHLAADLTYLIGVPGGLFFAELVGGRWRRVFRWAAGIAGLYAVIAIAIDAAAGPWKAIGPNAPLVVGSQALVVWALLRPGFPPTHELRVVRLAYAVFVVFVLNENAKSFGLPSLPKLEWVGFSVLLAGLGYATARNVFEGERRLLALAQEMETARRIQASILPRALPRLPGLSLAARYEPMTAVAGDFYDVVTRGDAVGILVADVSGHGVPAALVASMVKVAFAAQAAHAHDPARVLSCLNRAMCGALEGTYVTAAYGWIDIHAARLDYASAGHPPLLLKRLGAVERLADNGLLMGLLPDAAYPVTRRTVGRGDRLLFYTDGAIEAMSPRGEMFELERLAALLQASGDPPDGLADRVLRTLSEWRGGESVTDDLTLLVLDVLAPPFA